MSLLSMSLHTILERSMQDKAAKAESTHKTPGKATLATPAKHDTDTDLHKAKDKPTTIDMPCPDNDSHTPKPKDEDKATQAAIAVPGPDNDSHVPLPNAVPGHDNAVPGHDNAPPKPKTTPSLAAAAAPGFKDGKEGEKNVPWQN